MASWRLIKLPTSCGNLNLPSSPHSKPTKKQHQHSKPHKYEEITHLRLYEALKGLGGIVRCVSLLLEGHGYYSREGVGHVLWEMVNWCDRYLKDKG
ncbi:hypothetical protein CBP13_03605 [Fischerella thermalis WC441]|nr:hypothetical protein CBP19_03605 [Fischerella thermalis WC1110]PLZ39791.1 hypothetical protein CBP25_20360 [Fischerella thermalis WC527]PLZ46355.1 hypothetical protein CBP26_00125 [Fischerella thermalis WC538]PLZ55812.1 hypothetical protein CBP13_03605 [Fischerella thermalis WC441]PLZ65713.1 hypothetical protein CBP23_05110 [Fischerella thermalis WC344]